MFALDGLLDAFRLQPITFPIRSTVKIQRKCGECGDKSPHSRSAQFLALALVTIFALPAAAQTVPDYEELRLETLFPAGGQIGQTVQVEFGGNRGGLADAREIVIDGPPGISVVELKNENASLVRATLAIAADAAPGRRLLRVRGDRCGLTNMLFFTVGRLPEAIETEPNNSPTAATAIVVPAVVNARLNPAADVDCFRFAARDGQRIVAAVLAHAIDSHGQYKNYGYVDAELQVLDEQGRVVAEASDTIGLDPLVEFVAPADGNYVARVQHVLYQGYPQAVYRLTLGEVPVPVALFPPGGRRGEEVEVELFGPNIPARTKQRVAVPADDHFPSQFVSLDGPTAGDHLLPFVRGNLPERVEAEPNDVLSQATKLELPMTASGRFDAPGDSDWYELQLTAGQSVTLETIAHRYLRSPVDTRIEIFDGQGKRLAENDDGFAIDYMSVHDFEPLDSRLQFTASAAGPIFIRVSEQTGSGGPRAVYRLSVAPTQPDFELFTYPDSVPVWGPGSTAAVIVKVERTAGLDADVEVSIADLPAGWTAGHAISIVQTPSRPGNSFYNHYGQNVFLTLTAPADAKPGTMIPLKIFGRCEQGGRKLERIARPMTWYYSSDIGFFRLSTPGRAVVANPQPPFLSAGVTQVTGKPGGTVEIPVLVSGAGNADKIDLVVNLATAGVACSLNTPASIPIRDGRAVVPFTIPDHMPVGDFGILVARTWRSDIRIGMPGPCTPLITLRIEAAGAAGK